MTKQIALTMGYVALVDDEDYEKVSKHKWYATKHYGHSDRIYAAREVNGKTVKMHSFITGYKITDHIEGNGLDNRRCNLRECTNAENQRNRGATKHNRLGFKGVTKRVGGRGIKRFRARIRVDYNLIHIGDYLTAEEAARAYDDAAKKHFGNFAWTNFK